ncbi:MAG: cation transporter [Thermomicrobium sp.]|nr:cation transporter [Thermomicrobium sp.]
MHRHEHQHTPASLRAEYKQRALAWALGITLVFMVAEAIGGWLAGSLALLADAAHMATDAAALGLALFASLLARRPATPARSYGFYRAEVLAALANAAFLILVCAGIFWEAFQRLLRPRPVDAPLMLAIALAGLAANGAAAWVLSRGALHRHDVNLRSAFLHVLGDLLGSVAAIAAGTIIWLTGWTPVDPLLSAAIGLLVLRSAWRVLWDSVEVLLEATPAHLDPGAIRAAMRTVPGVVDVHDLHVWTVTSGFIALSGHVEVDETRPWPAVLLDLAQVLRDRFGILHVTLQPEEPAGLPEAFRGCSLDSPEGLRSCLLPLAEETTTSQR